MELYIEGDKKGKKSRNGEMYVEEFRCSFWKKQGKYYYFFIILNLI